MKKLSDITKDYYTAMNDKNLPELEMLLGENVELISPMARIIGKKKVVESVKNFMNVFTEINISQTFDGEKNTAIILFDLICPSPIGKIKAVNAMTFEDHFITKMELIYDARPFEKIQNQIFANKK